MFQGDRISNEAVSTVTGDESATVMLAEVDASSYAEFSDIGIDNSPYNSSDIASQRKALIELDIHDCISASPN